MAKMRLNNFLPVSSTIWTIEQQLRMPPSKMYCDEVFDATQYPEGAREIEINSWNDAIENKKSALDADEELETKIMKDSERWMLVGKRPEDDGFKKLMFAGTQYRLISFNATGPEGATMKLEKVHYTEIEALKEPEYRQLFEDAELELPIGPIAPCLMIVSLDGYLALSVRGESTNKYPGALWGFGGDIDNLELSPTVGDHIVRVEQKEELSSFRGVAYPQYTALGIVFDHVLKKHDIPIITQFPLPYEGITKKGELLPDVKDVTHLKVDKDLIAQTILDQYVDTADADDKRWIGRPSAALNANLLLFGQYAFGLGWGEEVLNNLISRYGKSDEMMLEHSFKNVYSEIQRKN